MVERARRRRRGAAPREVKLGGKEVRGESTPRSTRRQRTRAPPAAARRAAPRPRRRTCREVPRILRLGSSSSEQLLADDAGTCRKVRRFVAAWCKLPRSPRAPQPRLMFRARLWRVLGGLPAGDVVRQAPPPLQVREVRVEHVVQQPRHLLRQQPAVGRLLGQPRRRPKGGLHRLTVEGCAAAQEGAEHA